MTMRASRSATLRRRRRRGFTLAEMATALAVSMVVVYAAVMSIMSIQRSIATTRHSATVNADASIIVEHIVRHLQAIGGSGVPIALSFVLEEAGCPSRHGLPACGSSDRLTIVIPTRKCNEAVECPQIPLINVDGSNVYSTQSCAGGYCCLRTAPDGVMNNGERKMFVFGNDGSHGIIYQTANSAGGASCNAPYVHSGQYPSDFANADITAPTSLYMVPVQVMTFYVDNAGRLLASHDHNNDGAITVGEVETLAVGVESLHFAVGYDIDGDGVVSDDGTQFDEWLGNSTSDVMGSDGLSGADGSVARMMTVGVVVSDKAPHLGETRGASVLNGTTVSAPRTVYGVAHGTVTFRNLDVYY